jgi:hypothetical protein
MSTLTEKTTFSLPRKKVIVKPILDRARGAIKDPKHEAYFLFGESTVQYSVPRDSKGNLMFPLTLEEKEFFEDKSKSNMNFEPGDLSPYGLNIKFAGDNKKPRNFWATREAKVTLTKNDLHLDLSNPADYLKYKILLANKDEIAPSAEERLRKATYRFMIVEENYETSVKSNKFETSRRAMKAYDKIENDSEKLRNVLIALNKSVAKSTKIEFLRGAIEAEIESDPAKFLAVVDDINFDTKMLIVSAVNAGIIRKSNHKYFSKSGEPLALAGEINDLKGAINYLNSPANQEYYMHIQASLNDSK